MKTIKERIDELLKLKNWSYYELSQRTGISGNAIYNWSRSGSVPSLANVIKICEAMDITLEQFFCDKVEGLSKEENRLLQNWFLLSDSDKKLILSLIELLKRDKAPGDKND